jgi:hypothetical protein
LIHQLLVCADDVNLLEDNINTIKIHAQAVRFSSIEVGLEVNREILNVCRCLITRMQENYNLLTGNILIENMPKLKYFGMKVTNQNLVHEEIKILNWGNGCYCSIQNLVCSCQLSKNVKTKIHTRITILLHVVLCGCETWSEASCDLL